VNEVESLEEQLRKTVKLRDVYTTKFLYEREANNLLRDALESWMIDHGNRCRICMDKSQRAIKAANRTWPWCTNCGAMSDVECDCKERDFCPN